MMVESTQNVGMLANYLGLSRHWRLETHQQLVELTSHEMNGETLMYLSSLGLGFLLKYDMVRRQPPLWKEFSKLGWLISSRIQNVWLVGCWLASCFSLWGWLSLKTPLYPWYVIMFIESTLHTMSLDSRHWIWQDLRCFPLDSII